MKNQEWSIEIDSAIQEELDIAGLTNFDGNYRFIELSDETLALVRILNRPSTQLARINPSVEIIDYRTNYLLSHLMPWKLAFYKSLTIHSEELKISKTASKDSIRNSIHEIASNITNSMLPRIKKDYFTTTSITEALLQEQYYRYDLLCVSLSVMGQIERALELAYSYSQALQEAGPVSYEWQVFKSNFDRWFKEGASIPSKLSAKEFFFKSKTATGGNGYLP